ncbi:nitrate- and nitrite sensing domain-containing protein [Streptomyces sp. 8N616]|uniref:nitrate- and nitrite sensing domain-containing protein n=1 Tax=Streptomyces sp. 8N616 TaxID=3457414 RepID=UPI003FD2C464
MTGNTDQGNTDRGTGQDRGTGHHFVRAGRRGRLLAVPGWNTIRGRVAVVLAVPTCLLLVLTGLAVVDRGADWAAARETQARVDLVLRVQALVHELQRERGLTNGLLGGARQYRDDLGAQRERSDLARAELAATLGEGDADTVSAVEGARRRLLGLAAVRSGVDGGSTDRGKTFAFYTASISALIRAQSADGDDAARGDRALADGVDALQALADATESVALERGSLNGVFAAKRFREAEYLEFTEVRAARVAALDQYGGSATPAQRKALDQAFATGDARRATALERRAASAADGSRFDVDPAQWWRSMTVLVDDLYAVQQRVGADVRARAGQLSDSATAQLAGFLGLGVLIVAVATALAVLSARSITRPLGALADEADEVAGARLSEAVERVLNWDGPEAGSDTAGQPVPVPEEPGRPGEAAARSSAREIAQLAAALRNVERTAVGLAAEQAVLRRNTSESLANLGRRNQSLLRRQLGLITTLESQEVDPDALGELFELDHLATRMRRNAESLLVLVGEHAPPRSWSGTVTALEVVQSAVSEVEQYRRVSAADVGPCRFRGHAVAELSHLLAELIENALVFSPPHLPVEVYGWRDVDEYCLAVVDRGIGMSAAELDRANARLAGKESFLVAPTRFLGHYVVGRLAARLGAQVELRETEGSGTTAYVALPSSLLAAPIPSDRPPGPDQVRALLNGFREGVARGAAGKDSA